ncbi:glycosyl transferase protein [Rutstroemia sp. NJR-2017a BBW]|nr:glycosyl transferase protein [Rutstroemia sp. NJR-2017a BBW]
MLSLSCILLAFLAASVSGSTQICGEVSSTTTKSGRYTYLTEVVATDNSGAQCISVTIDDDTSQNTTSFAATWEWNSSGDNKSITHSFPNVNLNLPSVLPVRVDNISLFPVTNQYALYSGNKVSTVGSTSAKDLQDTDVVAAVYLNIFLDADRDAAQNATTATHAVMVWQASYGNIRPPGWDTTSTTQPTVTMAGIQYTLYAGQNTINQTVYSWWPNQNISSLTALDVSPLLNYLWRKVYIPSDIYVGAVQWGNDARHSNKNVTFDVSTFGVNIMKGTPVKAIGAGEKSRKAPTFSGLVLVVIGAVMMFDFQ